MPFSGAKNKAQSLARFPWGRLEHLPLPELARDLEGQTQWGVGQSAGRWRSPGGLGNRRRPAGWHGAPLTRAAAGQGRAGSTCKYPSRAGIPRPSTPSQRLSLVRREPADMLPCSLSLALLTLLCGAGSGSQPPCQAEMNKVKDLLELDCVGKGFSGVPPSLPPDTGILLLGSNGLAQVSLAAFTPLPILVELDLSNNCLGTLETGPHLPSLQQLLLSNNTLKSLPALQGLPNLRRLALGHNAIAELPEGGFRALGKLQDLELQGNRLRSVPAQAFAGLAELKDLRLSDNLLESLPRDLLAELRALEILRLERNRLRRLPTDFFPEANLFAYVYLAGNPWVCDCQLLYLRDWVREYEYAIYTSTYHQESNVTKEITENEPWSVVCQAPPQEKGTAVIDFETTCGELGDGDESYLESVSLPLSSWLKVTSSSSATMSSATSATSSPPGTSKAVPTTPPAETTGAPLGTSKAVPTTPPAETTGGPLGTKAVPTTPPAETTGGPLGTKAVPMTPPAETTGGPLGTSSPEPFLHPTTSSPWSPTAVATPPPLPGTTSFDPSDAPCLCTVPSASMTSPTSRRRVPSTWAARLAAHCCLLHLVLYLASLFLLVLATLAMLCNLGWVYATGHPSALRGSPGVWPSRYQQLPRAASKGQLTQSTWAPLALTPASTYRVCKTFHIGPLRHISWLFVSLPGPGRGWAGQGALDGAGGTLWPESTTSAL